MATINNIGGTSLNVFSINGNVSFYQGITIPDNKMGKNGDYYFKTGEDGGFMYVKRNGVWLNLTTSSMPDARTIANKVIYSNGENYVPSGITYNATDKSTSMDGALTIGKHPSATNSTSSKIVPTIGWINDPTLSTNVVHRSGKEKINGDKTFLQPTRINSNGLYTTILALESSDLIKGEKIPEIKERTSQTRYWTVCAVDKTLFNHGNSLTNIDIDDLNYNKLGQFEVSYNTDKQVETKIEAFNPNADDERVRIAIGWDKTGKKYSTCTVLPDDISNDNSIATTEWFFNKFGKLKSYNATTKKITAKEPSSDLIPYVCENHSALRLQSPILERGVIPTVTGNYLNSGISFRDSKNATISDMIFQYNENGRSGAFMRVFQPISSDPKNGYIGIFYQQDGVLFTQCPNPTTKDKLDNNQSRYNLQIATCKWANDQISSSVSTAKTELNTNINSIKSSTTGYPNYKSSTQLTGTASNGWYSGKFTADGWFLVVRRATGTMAYVNDLLILSVTSGHKGQDAACIMVPVKKNDVWKISNLAENEHNKTRFVKLR